MPITKAERAALLEPKWSECIEYLPRADQPDPEQGCGYTTPGWYFWECDWAHCDGPYETKEQADKACTEYAKHI